MYRVLEFLLSTNPRKKETSKINLNVKWFSPSGTGLKLNIDGAYNSISQIHGIGGVFRDSSENWIVGFFKKKPKVSIIVIWNNKPSMKILCVLYLKSPCFRS